MKAKKNHEQVRCLRLLRRKKKNNKQGTQTKPKYSLETQAIKTRGSALTHTKSRRGLCGCHVWREELMRLREGGFSFREEKGNRGKCFILRCLIYSECAAWAP